MAGVLAHYFPFLASNWSLLLCGVLAVVVVHLLTTRRKLQPAAVKDTQPWNQDVEDECGQDIGPPADPQAQGAGEMVPYRMERLEPEEMVRRSEQFYQLMNGRRSVRFFSSEPVPRQVVENAIRTAGTGPSGAHTEPWTFVLVSQPEVKAAIRDIVEREEEVNYKQRMGQKWVDDLAPMRTNWVKEYLTEAPFLVLLFRHAYGVDEDGQRYTTYYNEISSNIACGLLMAALHTAGLATLTSTPLNCGPQLRKLLRRPDNEKLVLLMPVGRPAADCVVPDLTRKPLNKILVSF